MISHVPGDPPAFTRDRIAQAVESHKAEGEKTQEMSSFEADMHQRYAAQGRTGKKVWTLGYSAFQKSCDHPLKFTETFGRACSCAKVDNFHQMKEDWKVEWAHSDYRQKLVAYLEQYADRMKDVDRIICFGLGNLGSGRIGRRAYTQHLAAFTISQVLSQERQQPIPIYAQEPFYCATCKEFLRSSFNMEVVEDPHGFLLIDKNTFIMTVAPDVPVMQIAVDVLYEEGGPSAMLCDEKEDLGTEAQLQ